MACSLTQTAGGLYNGTPGTLRLTLQDVSGTTTFVCANCKAWDYTDPANQVPLTTPPDAPTCTETTFTLNLKSGILYRIALAYAQVPVTAQAQLKEMPCAQVLDTIDEGKLAQVYLVWVP